VSTVFWRFCGGPFTGAQAEITASSSSAASPVVCTRHSLHVLLRRWCWQMLATLTPCIGSSGAGAGRCSRPRSPCIGSFRAGAADARPPHSLHSLLWRWCGQMLAGPLSASAPPRTIRFKTPIFEICKQVWPLVGAREGACWRVPPASFYGARVRACVLCACVRAWCQCVSALIRHTHTCTHVHTHTSTHARMRTHACAHTTRHTSGHVRLRTHDKIVVHCYLPVIQ